jgi:hypothetical protein
MEKGCGSTIWRTYKSEVRGKPERVRPDDPTNPWVELSRKTCSNGTPLEKHASDILISKAARRRTQSRGSGRCPGSGSFLAARSRTIGTNGCAASACRLFWADHGNPEVIAVQKSASRKRDSSKCGPSPTVPEERFRPTSGWPTIRERPDIHIRRS